MASNDVLTIEDVAEILRVSTSTVRKLIDAGDLKAFKVGGQWRIRRSDLDRYIEKQFK